MSRKRPFGACLLALLAVTSPRPASAQPPNALSETEKAEGFELLFDGSLGSFRRGFVTYYQNDSAIDSVQGPWGVNDSLQALVTTAGSHPIRSRRAFRDFDLRMDYRCDGSEGIYYRFLLRGNEPGATGVEYRIRDSDSILNNEAPGAAKWLLAVDNNAYHSFSSGLWNAARIVAVGDSVEHWLNGAKVLGYRYHSPAFWAAVDSGHWGVPWRNLGGYTVQTPGDRNSGYIEEGYVGFRNNWGGKWQIRNLRINARTPQFGPVSVVPVLDHRAVPGKRLLAPDLSGRVLVSDGRGGWLTVDGRRRPQGRPNFKIYSPDEP